MTTNMEQIAFLDVSKPLKTATPNLFDTFIDWVEVVLLKLFSSAILLKNICTRERDMALIKSYLTQTTCNKKIAVWQNCNMGALLRPYSLFILLRNLFFSSVFYGQFWGCNPPRIRRGKECQELWAVKRET